jgi:predicted metal-dependent hydrolase
MNAQTINKGFYQGILQIAVGLYHLSNLNWQGAAVLLGEGIHRLNAYEDSYGGIDVANLVNQANDWLTALQRSGPERIQQIAAVLLPPTANTPTANNKHQLAIPQIQME